MLNKFIVQVQPLTETTLTCLMFDDSRAWLVNTERHRYTEYIIYLAFEAVAKIGFSLGRGQ